MAAERRKRISHYLGPRGRVSREDLPKYEGEWVAEMKHDGEWCLVTIVDGVIESMDSRTGLPLPDGGLRGRRVSGGGSGQLAGEIVPDAVEGVGENGETARVGTRRLHFFEPLSWNGHDLRDLPLEERREALEMIFGTFTGANLAWRRVVIPEGCLGDSFVSNKIFLVERREVGLLAWYDEIMASDSRVIGKRPEGLVLKKKGSGGRATCADGKVDTQLKCKPLNTISYVVVGPDGFAEKGTPKIALGLYKQTKDGLRVVKCMSPTWPAGMDLQVGMVVEVEGAEVFPSGAIRHGYIKRIRLDKRAEDCTLQAAMEAR